MKNLIVFSAIVSALAVVLAGCQKSVPTIAVLEKESITVSIMGNNPPLANVAIDMLIEFTDSIDKTTNFKETDEIIKLLKDDKIDVIISFDKYKKDKHLSAAKILESETDIMYIITRKKDIEFKESLSEFLNNYHKKGDLFKLAQRYISVPSDFTDKLTTPFEFK